jgi:nucleoside-diphosphate-sugar epimerase
MAVTARRNYLGLDNLCALLELCAFDPRAAGETFVAADPWSVDLPTVLRTLGESMGRRVRLWSVQPSVLRAAGNVLGLSAEVARLTSSLEIDSSKACRLLQWQPAVAFREEMDRMVGAYVAGRGRLT